MSNVAETSQAPVRARPGPDALPEFIWSPVAGGLLVMLPGLLGMAFGQPWLFPSLGPTAYLQAAFPQAPTSKFSNALPGHVIGMLAGFAAVLLLGAADAPSPLITGEPVPIRVWATGLGVAIALLAQAPFGMLHPPAAATTMLITLGAFRPTWADAGILLAGIVIVVVAGEVVRRLRLAQPGQK